MRYLIGCVVPERATNTDTWFGRHAEDLGYSIEFRGATRLIDAFSLLTF